MSTVIDERVVEMRFDNQNFEKNVRQTMNTLDDLSAKIEASTSAEKVSNISRAFQSIDLSPMLNSLDAVNVKFSAMQTIGDTIVRNITNSVISGAKKMMNALNTPMQLIETGGKNRAKNIEQAKFQLEGLGVTWASIEEDINYGVKDTAYGLDSAAKAASQLVASQVELGEDMRTALRGISGVAAMTNSSYDDIAHVFTTVAGNGRLMGDQLNQLAGRGLNAASTLAKAMNTTEAEVRDMVSKGKIDFQTFAKAMDDAFGSHAKDANKTFDGAMSNVRAALARTGVDVATAGFEGLRQVFVELIPLINSFNTKIKPLTTTLSDGILKFSSVAQDAIKVVVKMLDNDAFGYFITNTANKLKRRFLEVSDAMHDFVRLGGVENVINGFTNVFKALLKILKPIGTAFDKIFPPKSVNDVVDLTKRFETFTSSLIVTDKVQKRIELTFTRIFKWVKIVGNAVKTVYTTMQPFVSKLLEALEVVWIKFADPKYTNSIDIIGKAFEGFGKIVDTVCGKLTEFGEAISALSFQSIADKITSFGNKVKNNAVIKGLVAIFENVKEYILNISKDLSPLFEQIKNVSKGFFTAIGNIFENFNISDAVNLMNAGLLGTMILQFKEAIGTLRGITGKASMVFTHVNNSLIALTRSLKYMAAQLKAEVLLKLAKAIALMAVSIFLLAAVEPEKITTALGALTVGLIELMTAMKTLNGLSGALGGFVITAQFSILTNAILKLSAALLILSFIPLDRMITSLIGMGAALQILTYAIKNIETSGGLKGVLQLSILAGGLILLATAMKILSTIDPKAVFSTLILLGVGLAELAVALNFMVAALPGAAALLIASAALLILAPVLKLLGTMKLNEIGSALIALGGSLLELAVGLTLMVGAIPGAIALTIASVGLLALAGALKALSTVDPDRVGSALLLLGASLLELAIGLTLMFAAMPGVIALNAAVGALALLVPILKALGNMNMTQIKTALIAIGGALAVIGVSSMLLAVTIPFVLAMAVAIGVLAASVYLAGTGAMMLATAFTVFASVGTAATTVLINGLKELIDLIPTIVTRIGEAVVAFAKAVIDASPAVAKAIISVIENTCKLLNDSMPIIFDTLINLLSRLSDAIPMFVEFGIQFIEALVTGIADASYKVTDQLGIMIVNILKAIGDKAASINQAGWDLIIKLIDGMATGLEDNKERLRNSIENFLKSIFDFMLEMTKVQTPDIGRFIVEGLLNGITANHPRLTSAINKVTGGVLDKFKEGLKEHSPSKATEEDGINLNKGLVNGIDASEKLVSDKISEFGTSILGKFRNAISGIQKESVAPTVSPVLDLTNVESGKMKLNDLLSIRSLDISNAAQLGDTTVQTVNENKQDNSDVVNAINSLNGRVEDLGNKMSNLRVMLDGDTVVGKLASKIDRALGSRAVSARRANGSSTVSYKKSYG